MSKRKMRLLMAVCLCASLVGCAAGSTFNGNKVTSEEGFQMDYSILDKREEAVLELAKGDVIQVEISHETGTVDIVFGQDGAEPIYEGNGLSNSGFTLNITESGIYQISVTGNHARGSVAFMKIDTE